MHTATPPCRRRLIRLPAWSPSSPRGGGLLSPSQDDSRIGRSSLCGGNNRAAYLFVAIAVVAIVTLILFLWLRRSAGSPQASLTEVQLHELGVSCDREQHRLITEETHGARANACEDFYSFVCNKRHSVMRPLEQRIAALAESSDDSTRHDGHDAATATTALLYRSCLYFVSSDGLSFNKEQHANEFFDIVRTVTRGMLRRLDTPAKIVQFQAILSKERGAPTRIFFATDGHGTHFLDVRPPLSGFVDNDTLSFLLAAAAEALAVDKGNEKVDVNRLLAVDNDLQATWNSSRRVRRVSLETLASIRADLSRGDWHVAFSGSPLAFSLDYDVMVRGLENLENALEALFVRLKRDEAAVYLFTYILLPEEMLIAHVHRRRQDLCFALVRHVTGDIWYQLESTLFFPGDVTKDALSLARSLITNIERRLVSANSSDSPVNTDRATIFPRIVLAPSLVNLSSPTMRLLMWNIRPDSLYRNLLELRTHFAILYKLKFSDLVSLTEPVALADGRGGVSVTLTPRYLQAPFFCHGQPKQLNAATLGVAVVSKVLEASLDIQSCGSSGVPGKCSSTDPDSSKNDLPYKTAMSLFGTCLEEAFRDLNASDVDESSGDGFRNTLEYWTTAFQVAEDYVQMDSAADNTPWPYHRAENAVAKAFFERYCYYLCEPEDPFHPTGKTRWARHLCNAAAMSSPMFAALFDCAEGQTMAPRHRCLLV
ncbi:hypothetical protein HPB52_013377 [Rhipicephalus sanguineus]|uniref:Uncharacterized protein n=1 Tax=Rhipicephalus sanguineus TaxID=34632 RepID=A0A9D4Q029_RHISA|nr:hypothetical protein HPB52_013377 [Rhipicephalus sanguineus]